MEGTLLVRPHNACVLLRPGQVESALLYEFRKAFPHIALELLLLVQLAC